MSESKTQHDIESEEARRSGDPERIRRLYHSYGEQLFEGFAGTGAEIEQHGSGRVAEWQARHLPRITSVGRVLDVGCGPRPEISLRLAASGRRVVCTDLSFGLVKLAREVARREGRSNVRFVVADAEALPFRDGTIELVVSDDVIEHVPDPDRMTAECARVVAPGGLVSVSTPNGRAVSVWADRALDLLRRGRVGPPEKYFLVASHLREFTRRQLAALFGRHFGEASFVAVGWEGNSLVKRVASEVTGKPPFRGLCRHWVVLARRPAVAPRRAR